MEKRWLHLLFGSNLCLSAFLAMFLFVSSLIFVRACIAHSNISTYMPDIEPRFQTRNFTIQLYSRWPRSVLSVWGQRYGEPYTWHYIDQVHDQHFMMRYEAEKISFASGTPFMCTVPFVSYSPWKPVGKCPLPSFCRLGIYWKHDSDHGAVLHLVGTVQAGKSHGYTEKGISTKLSMANFLSNTWDYLYQSDGSGSCAAAFLLQPSFALRSLVLLSPSGAPVTGQPHSARRRTPCSVQKDTQWRSKPFGQ